MSIPGITINPYDEIQFPSQPLSQSQPDRLAAVAQLFGLQSPPPDRCRVLELGCATGGNILPMADRFPDSEFVGIDYSRSQLLIAEREAAQIQLPNLKLLHADIAELGDSLGKFDYIICHGVYSWVPLQLQETILELCRASLTERGVAYISYNVYPGWHLRMLIRELMCEFSADAQGAKARCIKGRQLLEFLAQAAEREATPYGQLLKSEVDGILKLPDGYICHEYFEANNWPCYFHEFATRIEKHGLQYVGDALPGTMFASSFGPQVENRLQQLAANLIEGEQHLDLLRNRGFRQSLVCHVNVPLTRTITAESLANLRFYGQNAPENPGIDLRARGAETFRAASGITLTTSAPALKAALCHMHDRWPRAFTVDELLIMAGRLVAGGEVPADLPVRAREALGLNLVNCMAHGMLEISALPDGFTTVVGERPRAGRVARFEALAGRRVTNRRHELVDVDDATRNVLCYLDGRHDRQALVQELIAAVNRGDVSILVGGIPATSGETVKHILEQSLDESLRKLATSALLIE